MSDQILKTALIEKAHTEGFCSVGITGPQLKSRHKDGLSHFLTEGWQGDMNWMEEKQARREDPSHLWPEAKSIIILAMNYGPEENPLPELERTSNGVISVYAKGKDYHGIVKQKLKNIARWFVAETGSEVKVFVDTAPVMEKPLAMAAGIGWQGKHTNLVSNEYGSWIFLGAIFTTHEFVKEPHKQDQCGSCQKCLDICPTNAFPAPYQLDARRCISYLTIEHQGLIPLEFRKAMGNRIYGCDDCLATCPWNKFAKEASEQRFSARDETDNPELKDLLILDDQQFRTRFKGTPIKRTGRDRFIRNCLIAAGNSGDEVLVPLVAKLLQDDSPLVRASAVWSYGELASQDQWRKAHRNAETGEQNQMVLEEWQSVVNRIDNIPSGDEAFRNI